MHKKTRIISIILAVVTILAVLTAVGYAIDWNGTVSGGAGLSHDTTGAKFRVNAGDTTTDCVGYRFSVINENGDTIANAIDVFRNTEAYNNYEKSVTKYNKNQLIAQYNSGAYQHPNLSTTYEKIYMNNYIRLVWLTAQFNT